MLHGEVEHSDSLGNKGVIKSRDIMASIDSKSRFLLITGDPLNEPLAGRTGCYESRQRASESFEELRDGSFINGDTFHKVHEEYCKD